MENSMSSFDGELLTIYLQGRLPSYFQGHQFGCDSIQLVKKWTRSASIFYRFQAETRGKQRFILTKVPLTRDIECLTVAGGGLLERPRLYPVTDAEHKYQLEYRALVAIQNHINQLNDPRFGAVRVLDFLPDQRALVMEELQDTRLDHLFLKANRVQSWFTDTDLSMQFYNAGAWLRAYHALPKQDLAQVLYRSCTDFTNLLLKFTDFLAERLDEQLFFQQVCSVAVANAYEVLPETLPLGMGHRDYTMRNILVGLNGRVTGLDTLAKWRTPIYEDIACFLIGLKMNRLQVLSQGAMFSSECLKWYEQRFLEGYFELESIPYEEIRLYELLILLNKWSAWISNANSPNKGSIQRAWAQGQLMLAHRFFRQSVQKLILEL
jgi:hypothetical protein